MSAARWDRYPNRASARRAAARELHPDRGGDPAAFAVALASIDAHFTAPPPVLVRVSRRRVRMIHPLRRILRRRRFIQL
ncbi:hypothetical protein [Mycolicibacterium sp.]|uniref:hypothetical protein n=1 Tax=Mycolicibacterium sp. TaxID=2320850 RepID=UPI001A1C4458|nr:hypothetical protein [Mycolicibacterium sp.]MBJ7338819.1 hypothetical protein [Mycolicibacterium sp.]